MHTKDILAQELRKHGLDKMADRAAEGYYHDFLSSLIFPEIQLVTDLTKANQIDLARRVADGEFDASPEESSEWAESTEEQESINELLGSRK